MWPGRRGRPSGVSDAVCFPSEIARHGPHKIPQGVRGCQIARAGAIHAITIENFHIASFWGLRWRRARFFCCCCGRRMTTWQPFCFWCAPKYTTQEKERKDLVFSTVACMFRHARSTQRDERLRLGASLLSDCSAQRAPAERRSPAVFPRAHDTSFWSYYRVLLENTILVLI